MREKKVIASEDKARDSGSIYWIPPLLWMGMIFYFSTDNFSGENTGSIFAKIFFYIFPSLTQSQFNIIHFYIRKAAHFTEYAVLALLLYRAIRRGRAALWRWSWAIYAGLIVAGYALLDEFHQTLTASRVGSIYDSLTDISGGLSALFLIWLIQKINYRGVRSRGI